jgi:hypothetical protein
MNSGVEDVNTVCPVVVEGFIYNIPGVALPLVVCDFVRDVVLQSSNEGCICPGARGDLKCSGSWLHYGGEGALLQLGSSLCQTRL